MSTPVFRGSVAGGKLTLDARKLFDTWLAKFEGKRVTLTLTVEARPKSQDQLGYLFGVLYPFIAREVCGYTPYESTSKPVVDTLHDALMRQLGRLRDTPKACDLAVRQSLAEWSLPEVSAYIEELRTWAVIEHGCVTPDAEPDIRKRKAAQAA